MRGILLMPLIAMMFCSLLANGARAAAEDKKPKDVEADIDSGKWNPLGEDGVWLSPVYKPSITFDELIYSWNVKLPEGEGFRLYLQVTLTSGSKSPFLYAGYWGDVELQESRENPSFDYGYIAMDQLLLKSDAESFQFKLESLGEKPLQTFPSLHIVVTDNSVEETEEVTSVEAKDEVVSSKYPVLDLPVRYQFDSSGTYIADKCQSAAVASAMEYFGSPIALEDIIECTMDPEYNYPGIWPRTIGAATQHGFDAYIDRFRDWDKVLATIKQNKVILASILMPKEGDYIAPPYDSMGGHIVAINGVTADGRVIVTDSALSKGNKGYRSQWLKEDFEKVWMDTKGGVGMVICPPEDAPMKTVSDLPAFPEEQRKDAKEGETTG